jgi:hypothetical protein
LFVPRTSGSTGRRRRSAGGARRLEGTAQIGFAADLRPGNLLVLRRRDRDIGHDALRLDGASRRRVIKVGGDPQSALARERDDRLHRSLAKAPRPHHGGARVVLQGAGDDLGGRGRGTVDEDDHRRSGEPVTLRLGIEPARDLAIAAARRDDRPAVDEVAGNRDRLIEQPSRVVAQIEHEAGERPAALPLQLRDGADELVLRALVEDADPGIADMPVLEMGLDGIGANDVAPQFHVEGRCGAAQEGDPDDRPGGAADALDHLAEIKSVDGFAIDALDRVARSNSGARGRRIVDRCDHLDASAIARELRADAAEFTARVRGELAILLHVHIGGVRVEAGHHALQGIFHELIIRHVPDVAVVDNGHGLAHGGEITRPLLVLRRAADEEGKSEGGDASGVQATQREDHRLFPSARARAVKARPCRS